MVLFSAIIAGNAFASSDFRCVSVGNSGQITLTWMPFSVVGNTFVSYNVYRSSSLTGTYTFVAAITNSATTNYTDAAISGQTQSYCYYILTKSLNGSGDSVENYSDTLQSMFLDGTVSQGSYGSLSWNKISAQPLPTSDADYDIKRDNPLGTGYNLFMSRPIGSESFADTNKVCNQKTGYYVELKDQSGCISQSSIDTLHYFDNTPPDMQLLDSVSVNNSTGHAIMGWTPSVDLDTKGYYVLIPLGGNSYKIIDTLYGRNTSYYEYLNSQAENQSETYAVIAFDSCGNYVNNSFNFHTTMFLTAESGECAGSISLTWNKYKTFNSGTQTEYKIYEKIGNGTYNLLAATLDTSYIQHNLSINSTYSFYIQAIDNAGAGPFTSTSNIDSIEPVFPVKPNFLYLSYATVQDSSDIALSFYVDTAADVGKYVVMRAVGNSGNFSDLGVVLPQPNNPFLSFVDNSVDADNNIYTYKIEVEDICGKSVMQSNIAKTVLLKGNTDNKYIRANLNWTKYQGWQGLVKEYKIFRSINGSFDATPIATLPATITHFVDNLSDKLERIDGKVCYKIQAIENSPSFDTLQSATSFSNVECVGFSPIVYIPNAIVPTGKNRIFKPVLSLADTKNYSLIILNRWGARIFQSDNKDAGWDGTYKGKMVEPGVYVYLLRFEAADNEMVTKKGTVTVLR